MEQNNNTNQPQSSTPNNTTASQNYSQPQNGNYYPPQGQPNANYYQQQPPQGQNYQYQQQQYYQAPQATPDALENRGLAAICYLSPLFTTLALVANGKSAFVRHHANQGLALDILTILSMLMMIIPFLGWFAYGIFSIVLFVFRIMGILNARKYKVSELPICGSWKFIR